MAAVTVCWKGHGLLVKWSSQGDPKKVGGWPCQSPEHDAGIRPWVPHGRLSTVGAAEASGVTAPRAVSSSLLSTAPAVTPQVGLAQPRGQAGRVSLPVSSVVRGGGTSASTMVLQGSLVNIDCETGEEGRLLSCP